MCMLREWQARFHAALIEEEGVPDRLGLTSPFASRFEIYRNNVFDTLSGALALTYPAVEKLVGRDFFGQAARTFVGGHPPHTADLYDYGADFAAFVQAYEPACPLPYLADVARFEWAMSRALHAADTPTLTPADLAAFDGDPDGLIFTAHPASRTLFLSHPARAIALACLTGDEVGLATIDPDAEEWLLVHRTGSGRDLGATVWDLTAEELEFIASLFAGTRLRDAVTLSPEIDHGAVLGGLIARGAFAAPLDRRPA